MRKRALAIAAVLVLGFVARTLTAPSVPRALKSAVLPPAVTAAERGQRVYERYGCALCHGHDGKGGFANANAETAGKVPGVLYVAEGYTEAELRKRILDGLPSVGKADAKGPAPPYRMPGWAGEMSEAELADLVRYLMSLYPKSAEEKW